jgi:RNA polymerase sigma factor (sigma-70 family)
MRTEDGSIIHRCLNGEPEAFGILVDKYKEGIYAFAHTKLRDFRDAQDATQEVFVRAYRDLRSLRRWESFAFWLYRIASARCKLCIRTQSRRVDQDFIEDQDPKMLEVESMSAYRDDRVRESLQESMDSLPETYREVLMLHYFGGMTIKDIARAIGISPGAVGMRLSRARAQLKEEMTAMMDTAFDGQRLPAGFTFRIVEAVKRIKINPMPRMAGLPWGLSLAAGIIVTVMSLNPHVSITSDIAMPAGSPLSSEAEMLETGEIPVDIMKTSEISIIASKQGDGDSGSPGPQNTFSMAPRAGESTWARKANMPTARLGLSTGVVNGKVYAIGGGLHWPGGPYLSTVEAYDPAKDTWTKKADMPTARMDLSVSVVDGIVYAIGGYNGADLSTVEAYDPAKDTWTRKTDMPTARQRLSTSVVDGTIYAISGGTGHPPIVNNIFSTVEAYDPETDTWTRKADIPTARGSFSTSVVDGIIYAIGGRRRNGGFVDLSTVEAYDPATDTWTIKEDMPTARYWFAASVVNGIIYVIGGWTGDWDGSCLPAVEAYDPATDTWAKKTDMPNGGRVALSASAVDGYIYAIGGRDVALTAIVERFDPGLVAVQPPGKLPTKWGKVKSD